MSLSGIAELLQLPLIIQLVAVVLELSDRGRALGGGQPQNLPPKMFAVSATGLSAERISGLLHEQRAPTLCADFSVDQFATVRRLETRAPVAALHIFGLILVSDGFLRHLGLCAGSIQPEAVGG